MRAKLLSTLALLLFSSAAFLVLGQATAEEKASPPVEAKPKLELAIFAGGCFWCMEKPFDAIDGVLETTSGYSGGHKKNPTYRQVSGGDTGHTEVVRIAFDPTKVSYARLLEVFWRNIDPVTANAQFCDRGSQYRSAIFYRGEKQKAAALASRESLEASGKLPGPIVTEIAPAGAFYPAEDYHQDYYRKNPIRYRFYRSRCGRDARLEALWGKPARPEKPNR